MKHYLRRMLVKVLRDSILERPARALYGWITNSRGNRYDHETLLVMKQVLSDSSNCVDVGAYRGDILRIMLNLAPKGRIHAFEPIPANFDYLRNRFPAAIVHPFALSDHGGETEFVHVIGRPARSGLKKQSYPDVDEQTEKIGVSLRRLDEVVKDHIDFLKIDVEGAELQVLKGALERIIADKPVIVFEHEPGMAETYGTSSEEIFDFLTGKCSLQLSSMERWLVGGPGFSRVEFLREIAAGEFYFISYPSMD